MNRHAPLFLALLVTCLGVSAPIFANDDADRDGDGHVDVRHGGDDCDDSDGNRYPGNFEVCDADNHDEDCNPSTFGSRDSDQDGFVDVRCCNYFRGVGNCGTDCDDGNRAVRPASQVCDGFAVAICGENGRFFNARCPAGTVCVAQPNGTGVCMIRPQGYIAAPRFRPATLQALPPAARGAGANISPPPATLRPLVPPALKANP